MEFAINNSKVVATGHTPFFLNYGRHPVTPLTWHLPPPEVAAATTLSHCVVKTALRVEDKLPQVVQFTSQLEAMLTCASLPLCRL